MNNLWSKLENYLFDFVGLIIPGAYLFGCIFLIKVAVDKFTLRDELFITNLVDFIESAHVLFKTYLGDYFVIGALIIFFLLGHPIKVISKHFYKTGESFIDNGIVRFYSFLKNKFKFINKADKILASLYIKFILKDILMFSSPNHHPNYGGYRVETERILKKEYNADLENKWYPLYKIGTTIIGNENLSSLHQLYLAKYNLYRSLAFVSLLFGVIFFFSVDSQNIDTANITFIYFINFAFFALWYAFHIKYKRYWMLDGSDTLINLYYFLKKNEFKRER